MGSEFRNYMRNLTQRIRDRKSSLSASDIIESVELSNSMTTEQCINSVKEQIIQITPLLHTQIDAHELSKQSRILKRYLNLLILKLETGEGD